MRNYQMETDLVLDQDESDRATDKSLGRGQILLPDLTTVTVDEIMDTFGGRLARKEAELRSAQNARSAKEVVARQKPSSNVIPFLPKVFRSEKPVAKQARAAGNACLV